MHTRPESSLERFAHALTLHAGLRLIVDFLIICAWGWCALFLFKRALGPFEHILAFIAPVIFGVFTWKCTRFIWHRIEFRNTWYKKKYPCEVIVGYKGLKPIIKRRLLSEHDLNREGRDTTAYRNLDRPY